MNPSLPVAQKAHAMPHPACVEKHTVKRSPLLEGMATVSTHTPSSYDIRYFLVPSLDI